MNLAKQTAEIYFASRDNNLAHVKRQAMVRMIRRMPEDEKKALLARAEQRKALG